MNAVVTNLKNLEFNLAMTSTAADVHDKAQTRTMAIGVITICGRCKKFSNCAHACELIKGILEEIEKKGHKV